MWIIFSSKCSQNIKSNNKSPSFKILRLPLKIEHQNNNLKPCATTGKHWIRDSQLPSRLSRHKTQKHINIKHSPRLISSNIAPGKTSIPSHLVKQEQRQQFNKCRPHVASWARPRDAVPGCPKNHNIFSRVLPPIEVSNREGGTTQSFFFIN